MQTFELNTTISNLRSLRETDLSAYDAVYLGNIYCRTFQDNFLERLDDLREGIARVKDHGLRAYVTSYGAPRNDSLPKMQKALETAVEAGADAIEAHNLGVLRMVHEQFPGMPVHIGGFANVYTDAGAVVLKEYGAVRFTPNYEISLEEVKAIADGVGLPAEIVIHGKMPLGISDYCFLLEYEHKWAEKCPTVCQKSLFLRQEDWAMRSVGKGVLSGKDVCMLEHLPALLAAGSAYFASKPPMRRPPTAAASPTFTARRWSARPPATARWMSWHGIRSASTRRSGCAMGSTSDARVANMSAAKATRPRFAGWLRGE